MTAWWRSRSIPQRFATYAGSGLLFATCFFLVLRRDSLGFAILTAAVLQATASMCAYDKGFAAWRPSSAAGRVLRTFIYSAYWLRDGGGRNVIPAAVGVVAMALVVFAVGYAAWG